MVTTSTVSASVDARTKAVANEYIRKAGLTPNEVIRNLWEYIAHTGDVPVPDDAADERRKRRAEAFDRAEALVAAMPTGTPLSTMGDDDIRKVLRDREI